MRLDDPTFQNTYRIPSARLPGYDYGQTGLYFVTICTAHRKKYFGEVENGQVLLSPVGKIVEEELLKTPQVRPNVNVDLFVVMPNHVHVIIGIDNQKNERQWNGTGCDPAQSQEFISPSHSPPYRLLL